MMMAFPIAFLVVLVLTSGTLSASETAFFSLSSMTVRAYKNSKNERNRLVATLALKPRKLLVTILMLNVLVNILVQNVVSDIFGTFSSWVFTVLIPLVLVLVFGEVIPKTIAIANNQRIAYMMAPLIMFAERVLRPVRDGIVSITNPISKFFFFYLSKEKNISLDELKHALRASKKFGVVEEDEANLIRGFLNLEDFVAKEVMCPRQDILAYNLDEPLAKLINLFVEKECSRVPVYQGSFENMIGVITSKDFFLYRAEIHSADSLIQYLQKPIYVPETTHAKDVLQSFYKHKQGLVLIVDEYSSVCGLVTLEDLVEVVVGQIDDKRDDIKSFTVVGKDVIICSGKMELAELEEHFDVKLHSKNNMKSVGGWLIEKLGEIPTSGAKVETKQFLFHVLAADPHRVRRVYIRKKVPGLKGK